MVDDRLTRPSSANRDDWTPPQWVRPADDDGGGAATARPHLERARRERRETLGQRTADTGIVLGMAIAPSVVGLLAGILSQVTLISGSGSVPRGLILLMLVQLAAIAFLRANDDHPLVTSWVATLLASAVLVPLLALQVTLLREPYVALSRGSAAPAILATVVVGMVLLIGAVWAIATSWAEPDQAALLFMPLGLLPPAMIGMRSTILQQPALELLAEVLLLAALATAIAWSIPPQGRLFVPPVAVGAEFVLLWAAGHGPWFHRTSGDIVRVLYTSMLVLSVVLIVAVPVVAMWVKGRANAVRPRRRRSRPVTR